MSWRESAALTAVPHNLIWLHHSNQVLLKFTIFQLNLHLTIWVEGKVNFAGQAGSIAYLIVMKVSEGYGQTR